MLRWNKFQNESGSAAIEFTILAVPVFVLIFGSIEVSRLLWTYTALQETSASAARCTGLQLQACSDEIKVKDLIKEDASSRGIALQNSSIVITNPSVCQNTDGLPRIIITISHPFTNVLPFFEDQMISVSASFPCQSTE